MNSINHHHANNQGGSINSDPVRSNGYGSVSPGQNERPSHSANPNLLRPSDGTHAAKMGGGGSYHDGRAEPANSSKGGQGYRTRSQVSWGSWVQPTNEAERDAAIDSIITQLVEAQSQSLGTLVKLPERAIKWLIQESQEIFKKQPMMIDLQINLG